MPFTPDETEILTTLLDVAIPPSADGRLPGAGTLGLIEHVARGVERTAMLKPVVEYGLSALADAARARNAGGWAALSADERVAVVREFAAGDQFFLPAFLFLAYSGYYTHPRVVQALGFEARAPHPQGYEMDAVDLAPLLETVRRRGKMYREC